MALLLALLLDFGSPKTPVADGFLALTPEVQGSATTAGWLELADAQTLDNATDRPEGAPDYATDLTRDAIASLKPARLQLPLPAGDYELWAVAGDPTAGAGRLYDFDLAAGDGTVSFQMEEGRWFEIRRLRFHNSEPALTITLTPRSRWILNALVVAPAADFARLEDQLKPVDDSILTLPPAVMAEWQDLPRVRPRSVVPDWPPAARARGYLLHQRHYLENVYPDTIPYAATFDPELRCFATLGEAEPLTFTVLPDRDLADCVVTASDLVGPNGAVIPAAAIDRKQAVFKPVRPHYTTQGRYRTVPDYLRPMVPTALPAGINQRYWLTVTVPASVPGGIYRGQVTFQPGNAPAAQLPLTVRVLPFELQQDPGVVYGMYYRDPLDRASRADDPVAKEYYLRQAEIQAQDMNAHGTVPNITMGAWVSVPTDPGQPIEMTTNWELLEQKIDRCRRYGYPGPYVISTNTGGLYRRHMENQSYGSHLDGARPCPPAFEADYSAMIAYLEAGRKERSLGEWLYYPVDEPGTNPDQVEFMVQCLRAIQAGGGRTYVTADPTKQAFQPMMPYVNVWCTQPFLPDRETVLADMAARDVEYWCYPNHVNGENDHTVVAGARMTYGFGFWRSGFKVLIPWIYSSTSGHPFNGLDGKYSDFFNRPGPNGEVWPVPMYEAYREGWDDFRYVYTLQQAIAAAGDTPAAREAQAVLDGVWNAIEVKAKYKEDEDVWGYREFDLRRWQIAEQILKLRGL